MKDTITLVHKFVEYIPDVLEDATLYISIPFATVAHKCCCGCGSEVITPLSPTDWKLIYDGISISLTPSIGNWNFPCRSHYWIINNRVEWARKWSQEEINTGRGYDAWMKERYFDSPKDWINQNSKAHFSSSNDGKSKKRLWNKVKNWLF